MSKGKASENLKGIEQIALSYTKEKILMMLSDYMNDYYKSSSDESLIKMNYCVIALLIKQGLMDFDHTLKDIETLDKQKELSEIMKKFQS